MKKPINYSFRIESDLNIKIKIRENFARRRSFRIRHHLKKFVFLVVGVGDLEDTFG